jgi:hypothetical protein
LGRRIAPARPAGVQVVELQVVAEAAEVEVELEVEVVLRR